MARFKLITSRLVLIFSGIFLVSCYSSSQIEEPSIQEEKMSSYNELPQSIKILLEKNKTTIQEVRYVRRQEQFIFVTYGDNWIKEEISFIQRDTNYFVNEYELRLYLGYRNNRNSIIDTIKIKDEIFISGTEISNLKYSSNKSGVYFDSIISKSDISFDLGLYLCKVGVNFSISERYTKFVEVGTFEIDPNYETFLGFKSESVSGKRSGIWDEYIERYRLLLFRISDLRIVSNSILSPINSYFDR